MRAAIAVDDFQRGDGAVAEHEVRGEGVFAYVDARVGAHGADQRHLDGEARGVAPRVEDARVAVGCFEAFRQLAVAVIEGDAERDEFPDARGAFFAEHADGGCVA